MKRVLFHYEKFTSGEIEINNSRIFDVPRYRTLNLCHTYSV
jgi:hypothetical protein